MEEKSLRITGANTTFLNKLTKRLSRILIPTQIGLNGMIISMKRNNLIKAFEQYKTNEKEKENKVLEKKYDEAYTLYLETLDKYVMDSIFKKVKNNTASEFERNALSKYYEVTSLKEKEYVEYKYRKQKYLLDLDNDLVEKTAKQKVLQKYQKFYVEKMDALYKSILKNYSIKLADTTNIYDSSKDWIYVKILYTIEDYVDNILTLKFNLGMNDDVKDIEEDYDKYEAFSVGKLDSRDNIEKQMIILGISRKIFTHSIPLVVAEQCYEKLLKDTRILIQDTKMAAKRENVYNLLINLIEEYNLKLLSTKVYWVDQKQRYEYKKFWDKYKEISKIKDTDFTEYTKQKEVLFIKADMKQIKNSKFDYSNIIKYYKRKLLDYGAIKQIRSYRTDDKKYIGNIKEKLSKVSA